MRQQISKPNVAALSLSLTLALIAAFPLACTPHKQDAAAEQVEQRTFDTPNQAMDALVMALRNWTPDQFKALLGAEGEEELGSGDAIADRNMAKRFLKLYDEKHNLVNEGDGKMILVVGNDDWPMPIPLVKENDRWRFDGEAGKEEIVNRRIGRNELDVIEVCRAIVDAQNDYALANPNGSPVNEYARKFLSDPGKKNGLYWPTAEGETPSPLGPFVAEAVEEGYSAASAKPGDGPRPYHGYCYRMLTSQGAGAKGGAMDYIINGRMIGGFAAVAYPADYGNSGVMTFIVNQDGVVYQKDLGDDTEKLAKAMESFDPAGGGGGGGWQAVPADTGAEEEKEKAAGTAK